METRNLAIINGISLQIVADEKEQLVAVKPVCEILGVNYTTQVEKLKAHPIFGSVIPLRGTTGSDGKTYQMLCIPLQFFPGWLFTINPDNVKEEARENLIKYQLECNKVLFDYFFRRTQIAIRKEKDVAKAKEELEEKTELLRIAKNEQTMAKTKFDKALAKSFDDYEEERRQLIIPGFE